MVIYTVRPGDTIDSIAAAYNISAETISFDNQLPYPYALAVGASLLLSQAAFAQNDDDILVENSNRTIFSGGYAYPTISRWVLEQTLPYITDLFVFSYGFTTEGDLIPPAGSDAAMIELARLSGVAPILTLTPFDENGAFSNYLITRVINNPAAKDNLIAQLVSAVNEKGFEGVDIDFEYILAEDRIPFAEFVGEVRTAINNLGYPVSVALAPKTSNDQPGLLYEGKDYALLGEAADYVLLMTYEWGYTYGPPMAVAPLNKVRQVVQYALTKIPSYKIHLGIPNYGYDWTLPFVRGTSKALTIGHIEAVQIAIRNNAEIEFDPVALSPHFNYTSDGVEHEVWFEDVRSLYYKFSLITEFGLRGMSYWQIMRFFRANWLLQQGMFLSFSSF